MIVLQSPNLDKRERRVLEPVVCDPVAKGSWQGSPWMDVGAPE
jgi:hypothetical protein